MQHFSLDTMDGILHESGFLVVAPYPDTTVILPNMIEALARARVCFDGPYGLIIDRRHESCLDFPNYAVIERDEQICGVAIVCHRELSHKIALLETHFLSRKHTEVFKDLDPAIAWLRRFLPRSASTSP